MTASTHRCAIGLAVLVLGLAGLGCSSSTPLKKTTDAAPTLEAGSADLGVRDAAAGFAGPDALGPDLVGPDLAGPDLARTDGVSQDTSVAGKDAIPVPDLSSGNDTLAADRPPSVPDAPSNDVAGGDTATGDGSPRDGAVDGFWGCKPDGGAPPACNDDPIAAAVMGTCQPDGTCACKSPYVINPSTGRCMYPLRDSSVPADTGATAVCSGDYTACGCGCCGGSSSTPACYYPSLGETITAITAQDQATKSTTNCEAAGCSRGTHYLCCADLAPGSSSSAAYVADGYIGGLDHVTITKAGSDCASLFFARPLTASTSALKITMPSTWGVEGGLFGACGDAGALDQAKGGVGTLALRASGSQCLADLHATLFAFAADGTVKASRMDVDGIVVTGLPGTFCK